MAAPIVGVFCEVMCMTDSIAPIAQGHRTTFDAHRTHWF
jgi:hypothetical protein